MEGDLFLFFMQISILLLAALSLGGLARRINLPAIIGELLAGILLGPSIMGLLPETYSKMWGFTGGVSEPLSYFTQFAMLFFMFYLGLEIELKHFFNSRKTIIITSVLSLIVPMLIGIGIIFVFSEVFTSGSGNLHPVYLAGFMGVALSISALPIILKILSDLNILNTRTGSIIVGSAIINDLIGWSLFAGGIFLISQENRSGLQIATRMLTIVTFPFIMVLVFKWLKSFINQQLTRVKGANIGFVIFLVVLIAALAEKNHVHPFFAVFIMGILFKHQFYNDTIKTLKGGLSSICTYFFRPCISRRSA